MNQINSPKNVFSAELSEDWDWKKKKERERRTSRFQHWKEPWCLILILRGSGLIQVLWEAGCLTAAQPHILGLEGVCCEVSAFTGFLVQLVDVQVYKNVPFHPSRSWASSRVEAVDIISRSCIPSFSFYLQEICLSSGLPRLQNVLKVSERRPHNTPEVKEWCLHIKHVPCSSLFKSHAANSHGVHPLLLSTSNLHNDLNLLHTSFSQSAPLSAFSSLLWFRCLITARLPVRPCTRVKLRTATPQMKTFSAAPPPPASRQTDCTVCTVECSIKKISVLFSILCTSSNNI